jgi:hypothetical protein
MLTARNIFLVLALICFGLAALREPNHRPLLAAGLAFFTLAFLVA